MTEGFLKPNAKIAIFKAVLKFCIANQLFFVIIVVISEYLLR